MLNCQRSAAGYNSLQHRATSTCYQRPVRRGCFAERGRRLPTAGRMIHLSQQIEETHWVKSRIPQQLISATTPTFSLGKLRSRSCIKLLVEPETRPKRPCFLSLPQCFQLQMQKRCRPVVQKEPITHLQGLYQPPERSNSPVVERHPRTAAC